MQVRGRGWGQIRARVKTRGAVEGLSVPRGGSGAPWICRELCNWAFRHASARARLGPD